MGAETVKHPTFQPDHRGNWDLADRGECAVPGGGVGYIEPYDIKHERNDTGVAEAGGQQIDQSSGKVEGWAIGS